MHECTKVLKWWDVPKYGGDYQVNCIGEVRSLKLGKKRILRQCLSVGYFYVSLCIDGRQDTCKVHRLMVDTFYKPTRKYATRHLDGNSQNNTLSNLVSGTQAENEADKVRHGTSNRGIKNGRSKLVEEDVIQIREMAKNGMSRKKIAEEFNVGQTQITRIVNGKLWKYI